MPIVLSKRNSSLQQNTNRTFHKEPFRDSEVSTGSGSDQVSISVTVEIAMDHNPVATAPGTDLIVVSVPGA